ncbi:MAG: serine kinase [Negativicutes bacterium]|nr:serine kinase [Negativicutes bacterium]
MTVSEMIQALPLAVAAASGGLGAEVKGGYTSDLLSNVMGFSAPGSVWVTMQGHQNVIAVASLSGLAAVIVAGGVAPEAEAIRKAETEKITLLTSELPSFELVGRLYQLGVTGV